MSYWSENRATYIGVLLQNKVCAKDFRFIIGVLDPESNPGRGVEFLSCYPTLKGLLSVLIILNGVLYPGVAGAVDSDEFD
jgi:hypothetical protein